MISESLAYLIAGGGSRNPAAMVHSFVQALQTGGLVKPRIAYLGVANKDNLIFYHAMKSLLLDAGAADVSIIHLAGSRVDTAAAKRKLESADAIFLSGGEVEDGMRLLELHGLVDLIKDLFSKGKRLIGISAGSIMMGTHWVRWRNPDNDATAELFDCLGLIPTVFDTHAEDEDWKELTTVLQLLGPGTRGYGIPSGGSISADSQGSLVNLEKTLICFYNDKGQINRVL